MKKGTVLNSEISSVISRLGHTDTLVVCDAGLQKLSLSTGSPHFCRTVPFELPISAKSPLHRRDWADTPAESTQPRIAAAAERASGLEVARWIKRMMVSL